MKTEPTRLNDIAVGRRDIAMLEPADIKIDKGHNPRDYTLAEARHFDASGPHNANVSLTDEQQSSVGLISRLDNFITIRRVG